MSKLLPAIKSSALYHFDYTADVDILTTPFHGFLPGSSHGTDSRHDVDDKARNGSS
jgi:hypothetical protein